MAKAKANNKQDNSAKNKSGLTIDKNEGHQTSRVTPGVRLYLTADKSELVEEGHKDARFLYCTESKSVPREEYERLTKTE